MPISAIATAIRPPPTGLVCLSWPQITKYLCDIGVLPPELCPDPAALPPGGTPPALPPAATPPTVPPGPGVGPGPSTTPPPGTSAVPAVVFDKAQFPNIAPHIANAQKSGKPKRLRRLTDRSKIRRNRREACGKFKGPDTCDEYPFASSYEGGAGALVTSVPRSEQNSQGGTLSSFYQKHGLGDKDAFDVVAKP
jgi:hypothetical protein